MNQKSFIQFEQMRQLLTVAPVSILTSVILAGVLASIQYGVISSTVIIYWFSLIVFVSIVRFFFAFTWKRHPLDDAAANHSRLKIFRTGTLIVGLIWGSAGYLLFPANDSEHKIFLIYTLAGLSAGGVVTLSADLFCAVGFSASILLPLSSRLLFFGDNLSHAMGLAGILYLCFMVASLRTINRSVIEAISLRFDAESREKQLLESKERYRQIYNDSPFPMWVIEASNLRFLDVNERAIEHYGYTREEFSQMTLRDIRPIEDLPGLEKIVSNINDGKIVGELRHLKKNGTIIDVAINSISTAYAGVSARIGIVQDITERKLNEESAKKTSRAFEMLSRCGSAIVHVAEEQTLLNEICNQIVEIGGYSLAWVGFGEMDEEKSVRPISWVGNDDGFLAGAKFTWADSEREPVGTTIRTGKKTIIQDILIGSGTASWRHLAMKHDFKSCISLPLVINNLVIGALTIYSSRHSAFIENEVDLLEVLANDLSFGIQTLRTAAEHEKLSIDFKIESEKNLALLRNASDGIYIIDANGSIIEVSDSFCTMLGYTRQELHGMKVIELNVETPHDQLMDKIRSRFSKKTRNQFETRHLRKDGEIIDVEISSFPLELNGSLVLFNSSRDITERKKMELAIFASSSLLREMSEKTLLLLEEERKHIAREIHDELGQILTALRMDVTLISMRFGTNNADIEKKTRDMTQLLDQSVRCLRGIVSNLRPAALDVGISAALKWLCNEFSSRTGSSYVLQAADEFSDLEESSSIAAFRIAQELLNNTAKHSNATNVLVTLKRIDDSLLLKVIDDGTGFEPGQTRGTKSFGLLGIRERLISLEGYCDIVSNNNDGTAITICMPYKLKAKTDDSTIDC
jgi:PAS domain S-box-containing protein